MCFGNVWRKVVAWFRGGSSEIKEERSDIDERRLHIRFCHRSPFRVFPEYGVLDPDGWREPFELRFHQAAQRKKLEKGFRANCVTRASYNDLLSEVENLYDFLQITRKDVREVQERLAKAQERGLLGTAEVEIETAEHAADVHRRFQVANPFRIAPDYRCLAADPKREPNEARKEWQSLFKVSRREDELAAASQAQIKDLYDDLFRQVNGVHSFANSAHVKIDYLEARLRAMFGTPIPDVPPPNGD